MEKTKFTFLIQGSSSEPYQVEIEKGQDGITASCNCEAGMFGTHCKHRLRIFAGNPEGIVSGNEAEVALVKAMVSGTPLGDALETLRQSEGELAEIQKKVKSFKQKVAKLMAG